MLLYVLLSKYVRWVAVYCLKSAPKNRQLQQRNAPVLNLKMDISQ